ncbi:hypothetical protein Pla110_35270 [Polystyrenella longa]|uniref:Hemerythrin-like domain-containing protein n=1 Tax=Polystyrenella longa TaxID=2528007 RepID=A0A518CRC6_9PLAN|nr:hypothetical protein [Polystyrenella longa]QDU81777.1 hypothetical protein Pla110_35270 [Polystyrenella longa]
MCASTIDKTQLLNDCRTLEYILLGDLRDVLEETPDDSNLNWTIAIIDTLLTTLPRELDLAESGQYLHLNQREHESHQGEFDSLLSEKHKVYLKLRQLRSELVARGAVETKINRLKYDLHQWMKQLIHHHRNERHLESQLGVPRRYA